MTNFEKVGLFMKTCGQEVKNRPSWSSEKINNLRISLIEEELKEFKDALFNKDIKEDQIITWKDVDYLSDNPTVSFRRSMEKHFRSLLD